MTTCVRCQGKDGAHYLECAVGRLFERLLGEDYPWKAPVVGLTREDARRIMDERVTQAEDAERMAGPAEPEPEPYIPLTTVALVRQVQRHKGWRLRQLGDFLGVTPAQAGNILRGASGVPGEKVLALLRLLNEPAHGPVEIEYEEEGEEEEDTLAPEQVTAVREEEKHELPSPRGEKSRAAKQVAAAATLRTGFTPWLEKFAADCLILGDPKHNGTPWSQRSDWVPGYALHEAYVQWRKDHQPDAPEVSLRVFTMTLKGLGYPGRQVLEIGGAKPALYYGLTLRPKINWGQPRASEVADDDQEDHTKQIRTLMRQAKRAVSQIPAQPEPEPTPEPAAPAPAAFQAPEVKTNNGWFRPPTSGSTVTVPELTIEDIEAENAKVAATRRELRSTGPLRRPKQGEITNKDVRKLVNKAVDQGYIYWVDGSNHPKIQHPEDPMKRIGCAGSASDINAHKIVARDLRRIGVQL